MNTVFSLANPAAGSDLVPTGRAVTGWATKLAEHLRLARSAGRYDYQLIATGDGYRVTLDRGSIEVLADLSTLTSHDGRDWLDTAIDALEASLAGRASNKQLVREFDGVRIQDMTLAEQIEALQEFKRMRVVKKGRWKKTITSRFVN